MKIGYVSNSEVRDNGTGCHVRDALKRKLGFNPADIKWFQRGYPIPEDQQCDAYIYVDDGRSDIPMEVPDHGIKAFWAVDTHLGFEERLEWARKFDHVFCAQKNGAEKMREEGVGAHWLPLGCNPTAHPNFTELMELQRNLQATSVQDPDPAQRDLAMNTLKHIFSDSDLAKEWDIVFIGYMNEGVNGHPKSHNRVDYLDRLMGKEFRNFWMVTNCFHENMAARYAKGRIGFHVSILDDVAMRFFEIPSIGTAMLANRDVVGLADMGFVDGEHFVGYEGIDESVAKAHWMLDNPEEREEIARRGHELVREKHTYAHRVQQIIDVCGIEMEQMEVPEEDTGNGKYAIAEGYPAIRSEP